MILYCLARVRDLKEALVFKLNREGRIERAAEAGSTKLKLPSHGPPNALSSILQVLKLWLPPSIYAY